MQAIITRLTVIVVVLLGFFVNLPAAAARDGIPGIIPGYWVARRDDARQQKTLTGMFSHPLNDVRRSVLQRRHYCNKMHQFT